MKASACAYICVPTHVYACEHAYTHRDTTHTHHKITRKERKGTPNATARQGERARFAQSMAWRQQVADVGGMCSHVSTRRHTEAEEADQHGTVEALKGLETLRHM